MRRVHRFGFRRSTLAQEDAEHHYAQDGQELALPVLQGLKPEPAAGQILPGGDGGFRVRGQFLIVADAAAEQVNDKTEKEEQQKRQRQGVFIQPQRCPATAWPNIQVAKNRVSKGSDRPFSRRSFFMAGKASQARWALVLSMPQARGLCEAEHAAFILWP